jgi:hypothetical protein
MLSESFFRADAARAEKRARMRSFVVFYLSR